MRTANQAPGMGLIVRTVAGWLKGFILLFGLYIVFNGHITPGGGFAGGVIIACAFVMLTLAGGEQYAFGFFSKGAASALDSLGLLVFLAIGWLGMWWASGWFFDNFIATPGDARFTVFSGGTIVFSNIALGLKVGSSLFLVFTVMAALRLTARDNPKEGDR